MRRLADLELLEQQDAPATEKSSPSLPSRPDLNKPDLNKAIVLYEGILTSFPDKKDNDRIYYQLARAYEETGNIEKSLETLTTLVTTFPNTKFFDEAQFRRGEILFTLQEYGDSAVAYKAALRGGKTSPFFERATYKRGWALYKQELYPDAIDAFLTLIDMKLGGQRLGDNIAEYEFLSRGDVELVKDALRVTSLAFASLPGTRAIADYTAKREPPNYEFLLYRSLGDHYLKKERFLDAAETFRAFGAVRPEHPQGMLLAIDAIELYQSKGLTDLVLAAKKELATRYSAYVTYWANNSHHGFDAYLIRSDSPLEKKINDYVATTMEELGRYYHARSQKVASSTDAQEAIKWYQSYVYTFGQEPKASEINFLLAEVLFQEQRFSDAVREYEKSAYNYPRHPRSAEAGYAAILAYEKQKELVKEDEFKFWQELSTQSASRFAKLFPRDKRAPRVLANVADRLFAEEQYGPATTFAKRVLTLAPESEVAMRRQAVMIMAHTTFEKGDFKEAEGMYQRALEATPANDANRSALEDRLAAAIYKQGEALRTQGKLEESSKQFLRIGAIAPNSSFTATAEFDAAAALISGKQWLKAIEVLENFKKRYPDHTLKAEVDNNLAVAYLESGNQVKAADQLALLSAGYSDPKLKKDALWQTAELYEKGGAAERAAESYKRFIEQYPGEFEQGIEARQRLIALYVKLKQPSTERYWQQQLVAAINPQVNSYSDNLRILAATTALTLAKPEYSAYQALSLKAPLKESIALKKTAMERSLQALNSAAAYGVAEVTTEATYLIGEMYREFSGSLLKSERPSNLSAEALEQYELVLEDQAYPFEEKAIAIHEANAVRTRSELYDPWIKGSFKALATLLPARYGKVEKSESAVDELK